MKKPSESVVKGLRAACRVALVNFEAASDGSGDVSVQEAKQIEKALEWLRGLSQKAS